MPPVQLIDPVALDFSDVLFDLDAIREVNPQRFEMEQLTGIVTFNKDEQLIVGYKDVTENEFWVRGHMPAYPLMPGVLMCESAAQLCSFFSHKMLPDLVGFIGFGGMEEVRFRGQVKPGDRLVMAAKVIRFHHRQTIFSCQGFVGSNMVFHAQVIGVPIRSPRPEP